MHLLVFLYSTNQFFKAFQIDEVIYIELSILETNLIKKLTKIVTFVMLHSPCENINSYSLYMNNA